MNGAKTDAIYNGMGNKENLHNILVDNGKVETALGRYRSR